MSTNGLHETTGGLLMKLDHQIVLTRRHTTDGKIALGIELNKVMGPRCQVSALPNPTRQREKMIPSSQRQRGKMTTVF